MPRFCVPSYRFHKPSGQAVVTVRTATGGRRDVYLGGYDSPESKPEYPRVLAAIAVAPTACGSAWEPHTRIILDELLLLFLKHAEQHYRRTDGTPTDQYTAFKNALRPLHALDGRTAAVDFGPLALKAVRQRFIDADNCRTLINSRVGKLKHVFKWAVENELIRVAVHQALATVAGLQVARTARESEPVGPVDEATVVATVSFLNRHVSGLGQFQRPTGARLGEAMAIRRCDIDTSGDVWLYQPVQHKTRHKGKSRTIAIGRRAQELLKEFFTPDTDDYLFSPARSMEEFRAAQAAGRKTPSANEGGPDRMVRAPTSHGRGRSRDRYTSGIGPRDRSREPDTARPALRRR